MEEKKGKREEVGTLYEFSKGMNDEDMKQRNTYLLLLHLLSSIQMECCKGIEEILNRQGKYRFEVRHNHRQIMALVRKNMRNIFDGMSYDSIDSYVEDYDRLKDAIFRWAGLPCGNDTDNGNGENKTNEQ